MNYSFGTEIYKMSDYPNVEIFDEEYNPLTINDIYLNNVVWCAESVDSSLLTILVSKETVNGVVNEIEYDSEYLRLKIDDVYYDTFPNIEKFYNIEVGTNGVFRLDVDNRIIALETSGDGTMKIAYLINGEIAEGIESGLRLKIFEGEMKVLMCDTRVSINDVTYSSVDDMFAFSMILMRAYLKMGL